LKSPSKGLIHHWLFDTSLKDLVTNADITLFESPQFTENMLGQQSKAVYFNGSYASVPLGNYFGTTELTITTWIKIFEYRGWSRIFDFGNGQGIDNILLAIANTGTIKFGYLGSIFESNKKIPLNDWTFISVTLNAFAVKIYINGKLTASYKFSSRQNISTKLNYIGKSNWSWDPLLSGVISSIKIFNRELSQNEFMVELYPIQEMRT